MDYGVLSSYFDGAVAKKLVAVDIDRKRSNQHEFNGTAELRSLFGDDDIRNIPTTFVFLCDDADPLFDHGFTTWYDARRKHPTGQNTGSITTIAKRYGPRESVT